MLRFQLWIITPNTKQKMKKLFYTTFFLMILSFGVFSNFNFVLAGNEFEDGLVKTADQTGHSEFDNDLMTWVSSVIKIVLSLLGVIFLILIIYAGYLWMIDRGNDQQAQKAKDILLAAIIGLIIVMGAYAITSFVGNLNQSTLSAEDVPSE